MSRRDQGFADFVDSRGPALWRMASLLEEHPAGAEALLVQSLATAHRRWSSLQREGTTEDRVREDIASTYAATHRKDGTFTTPGTPDLGASTQRRALFSLTPQQRVLLVLPTYTSGVGDRELSKVAGASTQDLPGMMGDAETALRSHLPGDADPLLRVLDAAALHEVPTDLTAAALTASTPKQRGRALAAVAALVAVAAVVGLAVSPLGMGSDSADAQLAPGTSGIPPSLELPATLESLPESPIERASAALVVDGTPVVVDAETGELRAVFDPTSSLATKASDVGAHGVIRQNWSQAVLSPNGGRLLLVRPRPGVVSTPYGQARVGTGELYLVDIATGDVTTVPELSPTPDATGVAGIALPRLAWAPDSASFACACSGTLSLGLLDDGGLGGVNHTARKARAVAWGASGLAVADADGGWSYVDRAASETSPFLYSTSMAITSEAPTMYLEVSAITIYALGADKKPDGGHCTVWDAEFSSPISVLSVAERGGTLCTPMTAQAAGEGFLLVLPGTGSSADTKPFDVVVVDRDGASSVIATVPRATTAASFAGELVG